MPTTRTGTISGAGIGAVFLAILVSVAGFGLVPTHAAEPPETGEVIQIITATLETESWVECEGKNGARHVEVRVRFTGPAESNDPRLVGDFIGNARLLVDTTTLKGTVRDDFEIVDPATHALKVKGTGRGVFDNFGPYNGFVFAEVADGSHLAASISVEHFGISIPILLDEAVLGRGGAPPTGIRAPVVFKVGGPAASHPFDSGVVQVGACSDDFWD